MYSIEIHGHLFTLNCCLPLTVNVTKFYWVQAGSSTWSGSHVDSKVEGDA